MLLHKCSLVSSACNDQCGLKNSETSLKVHPLHQTTMLRSSLLQSCLASNALVIIFLGIALNQPRVFLFCINHIFAFLNYLDGTPHERRLNAYAGTPNEEFFHPLTDDEISTIRDIPVTSGQIPEAFEGGIFFRTGSNQRFPALTSVHVFEGDAMVHAFKFHPETNTISLTSGLYDCI